MNTSNKELQHWVDQVAKLTSPEEVHWCNGSEQEYQTFIAQMLDSGDLLKLNHETFPNCYLHRSDQTDVARVEHLTFICTSNQEDAGPNNNWMDPKDARKRSFELFSGSMKDRIMYVVPYCMGPLASPYSQLGVEITVKLGFQLRA